MDWLIGVAVILISQLRLEETLGSEAHIARLFQMAVVRGGEKRV